MMFRITHIYLNAWQICMGTLAFVICAEYVNTFCQNSHFAFKKSNPTAVILRGREIQLSSNCY